MFLNGRFFLHFVLLAVAVISLYQGAVVLKIGSYTVPVGAGIDLEGARAKAAGVVLLAIGALAGLWLLALVMS